MARSSACCTSCSLAASSALVACRLPRNVQQSFHAGLLCSGGYLSMTAVCWYQATPGKKPMSLRSSAIDQASTPDHDLARYCDTRLIQDKEAGIADEGSCQSNALTLAA